MTQLIIGLDLSLAAAGVAVWHRGQDKFLLGKEIKTTAKDQLEKRIDIILGEVLDVMADFNPELAIIEGYAFSRGRGGGRGLLQLGELGGVIKNALYVNGTAISLLPSSSLKLWATGFGDADKSLMLNIARRYYPACPTDNVADALHLARYGATHWEELMPAI